MSMIQKMVGILGFVVVLGTGIQNASAQCPTPPPGHDCKCNGDDTRWVCGDWAVGTPNEGVDFIVTYTGDTPRVEFVTPDDAWTIFSQALDENGDPTGPADLGDLVLTSDVSPNSGIFRVRIRNGTGAGAVDVKSLVLDSTDVNWTGHSSMLPSVIDGVINGALKVIDRSGAGGEIAYLTVNGPTAPDTVAVVGPIEARRMTGTNIIDGDVTNTITIGILDHGSLWIKGGIASDLRVTVKVEEAFLRVSGDVPSTVDVTIADMIGPGANLKFLGSFAGDLILTNGIDDPNVAIGLTGDFSGTIDLNNSDIAGQLNLVNGDGDVLNGRSILNGAIFYPSQFNATNSYDGTATFTSVAVGGEIESIQGAHIGGTIRVTGDVRGEVVIVSGTLKSGGLIDIGGNMTGEVHIGLDCVGDIYIGGSASGNIEIDGDQSGSVTVAGDASGDINISGDLTSLGSVTVGGALANGAVGGGRILVFGETSGAIKVGKNTGTLTLIHAAGGLATGATIEINTTEGNFNAEGAIYVGAGAACFLNPPDVTFDGCIRIYNDSASGHYGNLEGAIGISGCHNAGDLNICVDGSDNGNVNICQNGCTNQVGWSCDTCP